MKTGPKPKPDHERFFSKVNKEGPDHPHDKTLGKCWLWTGAHYPTGYGSFSKWMNGKTLNGYAHRFSYEYHKGKIIGGEVCHSCDVRDCVNPAHLWIGTRKQNIHDAMDKGRMSPTPEGVKFASGERHLNAKLNAENVLAISSMIGNKSQRDIAAAFGVSQGAVSSIATGKGWKTVAKPQAARRRVSQAGEGNPNALTTKDDVIAIRELRGKESQSATAARFGVDQTTVSAIQTRKTWKNIP